MKRVLFTLILALAFPLAAQASSSRTPKMTSTTPKTTTPKKTPPAPTPPVDTAAQTAANADVTAAKDALDKANKDYRELIDKLTTEFEASADYASAASAVKDAAAKLEAAKAIVTDRVKATPAYKAADAKEAAANAKLASLRDAGAPDDDIKAQATVVFELGAVGGKLIGDALDADPEVQPLQKNFSELSGKAAKLKSDFQKSLQDKDEVKTAKQTSDDAQKKYDDALTRLASAQKKR